MSNSPLKAAIVGAGYISDYHLTAISKAKNVQLSAVCDLREQAAHALAQGYPGTKVYTDLALMLDTENLDVVHILTQPDSHFFLASMAIKAGCHVIIEKPVTTSSEEADALHALAEEHNVRVGINHNFVFSRPFLDLKEVLARGELGPIKSVRVVWKKILPQVSFGPWNLWMLRAPGNILFETGSHSISELLSVLDEQPKVKSVSPRMPKMLPSGSVFHRRWDIHAMLGDINIQIDTAFDQGYEQHFVEVEGLFGVARADIENDIFTIDQSTGRAYDLERLSINVREGRRRIHQGLRTYLGYAGAKFIKSWTGGPYETSMLNGIADCYAQILGQSSNKETSLPYASNVAKFAEAIQAKMPKTTTESKGEVPPSPNVVKEATLAADVLIIGASGFIGKRLLQTLTTQGKNVRALVRNPSSLVGVEPADNCEVLVGDFRDELIIDQALKNIKTVIHLAVAHGNSLSGYLKQDSDPTLRLAEKCKALGIQRFIYTGTIDSLALAQPKRLSESDGVDKNLKRRNNYGHSKAITEQRLMALHKNGGFPLVILRPAIVLGAGGPPNHVGIANWFGIGRCSFWGNGKNKLPIVLVDDIVKAVCKAIEVEGIEGRTYNLSSEPCISAREYVAEIEQVLGTKIAKSNSSAFSHFVGDFIKWMVKVAARHPDKSRIPSIHDWRCREQHASFDTRAAQEDLDWQPSASKEEIIEKGVHEPTRLFLKG